MIQELHFLCSSQIPLISASCNPYVDYYKKLKSEFKPGEMATPI